MMFGFPEKFQSAAKKANTLDVYYCNISYVELQCVLCVQNVKKCISTPLYYFRSYKQISCRPVAKGAGKQCLVLLDKSPSIIRTQLQSTEKIRKKTFTTSVLCPALPLTKFNAGVFLYIISSILLCFLASLLGIILNRHLFKV